MQSEVLALKRSQVDLNACTLRLDPGMTKNDDGRVVYLTPELVELLRAGRARAVTRNGPRMQGAPPVPYLDGEHKGERIQDFRKGWRTACVEAMLELEGLEGAARVDRQAELKAALKRKEKPGLLKMIRHDFRRTVVRKMVNRGVPERVAMKVTGHKTRNVFDRYHIVSPADLQETAKKLAGTFSALPGGRPDVAGRLPDPRTSTMPRRRRSPPLAEAAWPTVPADNRPSVPPVPVGPPRRLGCFDLPPEARAALWTPWAVAQFAARLSGPRPPTCWHLERPTGAPPSMRRR